MIVQHSVLGNRLEKHSTFDTLYAELSVVEEQSMEGFSVTLILLQNRYSRGPEFSGVV